MRPKGRTEIKSSKYLKNMKFFTSGYTKMIHVNFLVLILSQSREVERRTVKKETINLDDRAEVF